MITRMKLGVTKARPPHVPAPRSWLDSKRSVTHIQGSTRNPRTKKAVYAFTPFWKTSDAFERHAYNRHAVWGLPGVSKAQLRSCPPSGILEASPVLTANACGGVDTWLSDHRAHGRKQIHHQLCVISRTLGLPLSLRACRDLTSATRNRNTESYIHSNPIHCLLPPA